MATQTTIPDGIYFLFPEGSAWEVAQFRDGRLVGTTCEALAATHAAARDRWDGVVPSGDEDHPDEEVSDAVGDAVVRAVYGEDQDPYLISVSKFAD